MSTPKYLQQQEPSEECKEFISTLPRQKVWRVDYYQYQGFWFYRRHLPGVISCQKHFQPRDSDVFLVTTPKSGTVWLKAIMFTLLNRKQYPVASNHPLFTHNPHDLVPFLDINLYAGNEIPDIASASSHRLFAAHMPYVSLPESVRDSPTCKLVYLCRNPKDILVSLWHFFIKLGVAKMGTNSIGELFEMFCKGVSSFGPFWDHVLEYWKQSKKNPRKFLFLKFEDMKKQPATHLRLLAEFLDCPFSADEVESGLVEEILKLCSFDNLTRLEVNKTGKSRSFDNRIQNTAFFRMGEEGDWKNHLSAEMAEKLDQITEEKLFGSGLVL